MSYLKKLSLFLKKPSFLIPFSLGLVTFILCILFVAHDLPFSNHPDEPAVVYRALAMGRGDFNPHFFVYPSLWFYILFLAQGFGIALGFLVGKFHSLSDIVIATFVNPGYFFVIARITAAVMASVATIAIYKTTERFGKFAALVAGLSFALFAPMIHVGHFAVTDIPMTAMIAIALYFIVRIVDDGSTQKTWILASIFLALAVGIKYTAGVLVIPYLVAIILRYHQDKKLLVSRIFLGGLIAFGIFFITSPYLFFDFHSTLRDFKFINDEALTKAVNSPWHYLVMVWRNWGLPIIIYLLAGFSLLLQKPATRKFGLVLASFIAAHLIVIHLADYKTDRFFFPLLPALAICIGYGAKVFQEKTKGSFHKTTSVALVIILMIIPVIHVAKTEAKLAQIPNGKQARIWAIENIPMDSIIFEDRTAKTLLPPNRATIEQRIASWQADDTGRANQFIGPYQIYLEQESQSGYQLLFTADNKIRSFSAGTDPSDYAITNIEKADYVIAEQQSIESTDPVLRAFYDYVAKNFTVVFTTHDDTGYVSIYQKN